MRTKILVAAREIFREKGFDRASMRDIIAKAGLSGAGIAYHHFKNKEAIVRSILEEQVELDFTALSEKLGRENDFRQFLNMTGEGLRHWLESTQNDIFLDLWPQIYRNTVFRPFMETCREIFETRFRDALSSCVQKELFAADLDIEGALKALIMLGHGLKMRFSFKPENFDIDNTALVMRRLYRALLLPTTYYPLQNN